MEANINNDGTWHIFNPFVPHAGSLQVQRLGTLTPLSDTGDPSTLLPHGYTASCDYWSTTRPLTTTRYHLTVSAPSGDEEDLLPLAPPTKRGVVCSSMPDDADWPCVDAEVGDNEDIWASLSPLAHLLTPSLLQAAYELLKVCDVQCTCTCTHVLWNLSLCNFSLWLPNYFPTELMTSVYNYLYVME